MSAGRDLTLITDRAESLRAFEAFERAFAAGAAVFPNHVVSVPSGGFQLDVYLHRSAGIWGGFRREVWNPPSKELLHIFGNSFGVADPNQHSSLSITVEINPPHEGENRRTAGVFLRDEAVRLYVGHT